jgi:putative redox protein
VVITREKGQKTTHINRSIKLHGMLSNEEKARLLEIANKCPVHQMLTNPIEVVSALEA